MTAAGAFALVAIVVWTVVFILGLRGMAQTPVPQPQPEHPGQVSAYVPARDEANVIEGCVQGALSQPQVQSLVVIDDRSSDGTDVVLGALQEKQPTLRVLQGVEPAPGHCGKPAALVRALAEAPPQNPWLLFLDADVVLNPGAVGALLAEAEHHEADLVTLIPRVTLGSTLERLVMPAVGALILAHHPPAKVNDPHNPKAFANGQVILIRRAVYERVGGHSAVVQEVLEDVMLARRVKAAGGRLRLVDGRHLAVTRMYEHGAELMEGWTKNLFLLMDARLSTTLGWAGLSLGLGALGWAALLVDRGALGLLAFGLITSMQGILRYRGGANPLYALIAPIGNGLATGLLLNSAYRHRSGLGVRWKGRAYGGRGRS